MDFLKKVHETVEKGGKVSFWLVLCNENYVYVSLIVL